MQATLSPDKQKAAEIVITKVLQDTTKQWSQFSAAVTIPEKKN